MSKLKWDRPRPVFIERPTPAGGPRLITARRDGVCWKCKAVTAVGTTIWWSPGNGRVWHLGHR